MLIKDTNGYYYQDGGGNPITEDDVLRTAYRILRTEATKSDTITNPNTSKQLLQLRLKGLEHEVFSVIFLDNRHRLLDHVNLFRGTINGATVHAREVVKEALKRNAAAVIFGHNHPSGDPEPSEADRQLTNRLKSALELVDIRVLDHIVVGDGEAVAFSERGWV